MTLKRKRLPFKKECAEKIYKRDNYTCYYCSGERDDRNLSIDHIVPVMHGGSDNFSNLVTSCRTCNLKKHAHRLPMVFEKQALQHVSRKNKEFGIDGSLSATTGIRKSANKKKPHVERKRAVRKSSRLEARNCKRIDRIIERIGKVSGSELHVISLKNETDSIRFRSNCSYHKYNYLSMPVSDSGEKIVIVDGPVKGSAPVSVDEAKEILLSVATFMSKNRSVRAGGSLGK